MHVLCGMKQNDADQWSPLSEKMVTIVLRRPFLCRKQGFLMHLKVVIHDRFSATESKSGDL